jgi:hypothetical protein
MKTLLGYTFAAVLVLTGTSLSQSANSASAREKFIGAWHLAWMESQGADGKLTRVTNVKGILLYTRDGHMSVQLMFPEPQYALSNDYVKNGYEASFGSYDVNEEAHTITHHVQGSITAGLVGKDLTRVYQFSGDRLIMKSSRSDEHWSVAWEHY